MTPFEALYGQKYQTPASWDNLDDRITIELEILKDMDAQLRVIKENLKEALDRNKIFVNLKRTPREF